MKKNLQNKNSISEKGLQRRIKQHVRAKTHKFFAICQIGFEDILKSELARENIKVTEMTRGGVAFEGKIDDCITANLTSRTATRILLRIEEFHAKEFSVLRKKTSNVPWELFLKKKPSLVIKVKCRKSKLWHSGRVEEEIRKGVMERIDEEQSMISDPEIEQTIFARLENDICTLSLDSSGTPLYKRGIKKNIGEAPLRETVASFILLKSEIHKYNFLLDPMCGSGTYAIEASMIMNNLAPGLSRNFSFMDWPVHKKNRYESIRSIISKKAQHVSSLRIFASDINPEAVKLASENTSSHELIGNIKCEVKDFFCLKRENFPAGKMLIVLNPPYGKRLDDISSSRELYKKIGLFLKSEFKSEDFAIIVPGAEFEQALGLDYREKIRIKNGGLSVTLLTGEI